MTRLLSKKFPHSNVFLFTVVLLLHIFVKASVFLDDVQHKRFKRPHKGTVLTYCFVQASTFIWMSMHKKLEYLYQLVGEATQNAARASLS